MPEYGPTVCSTASELDKQRSAMDIRARLLFPRTVRRVTLLFPFTRPVDRSKWIWRGICKSLIKRVTKNDHSRTSSPPEIVASM